VKHTTCGTGTAYPFRAPYINVGHSQHNLHNAQKEKAKFEATNKK
jgi:hypothetical protein